MKTKFRFLLAIILFLLPVRMMAKYKSIHSINDIYNPPLSGEVYFSSLNYYGSQYYPDVWLSGSLVLESGETIFNLQLRYNGVLDELIWLRNPLQQIKLDKYLIKEFSVYRPGSSTPVIFRRIPVDLPPFRTNVEIFAEILHEDNISLYVYRRISPTGKVNRKIGSRVYEYTQIQPDFLYFIVIPGEETIFLSKISRRNLYNAFPGYKSDIRNSFREIRGNLTREEKFTRVIKKLNETAGFRDFK